MVAGSESGLRCKGFDFVRSALLLARAESVRAICSHMGTSAPWAVLGNGGRRRGRAPSCFSRSPCWVQSYLRLPTCACVPSPPLSSGMDFPGCAQQLPSTLVSYTPPHRASGHGDSLLSWFPSLVSGSPHLFPGHSGCLEPHWTWRCYWAGAVTWVPAKELALWSSGSSLRTAIFHGLLGPRLRDLLRKGDL